MRAEKDDEEEEALEFIKDENYHSTSVRALQKQYDQIRNSDPIEMDGN